MRAGGASVHWSGEAAANSAPGSLCAATIEVQGACGPARSRHVQRHHPPERIEAALRFAGLERCAALGLRPGGRIAHGLDELRDVKAIFIARKPTSREEVCRR